VELGGKGGEDKGAGEGVEISFRGERGAGGEVSGGEEGVGGGGGA